jgi:hypothetical protein
MHIENPILLREAVPRFWRRNPSVARILFATLLCVLAFLPFLLVLFYWAEIGSDTAFGILMFLSYWPSFLCPALAPALVAGAIAGEREQQTWDGIVLSCLSPGEIVWGKLLSRLVPLAVITLALIPVAAALFLRVLGQDHSSSGFSSIAGSMGWSIALGWPIGLMVAFANAVMTLYISFRATSARSAMLVAYGFAGGAYFLSGLLPMLFFRLIPLLLLFIGGASNPGFGEGMFSSMLLFPFLFPFLWGLIIPLVFLPILICRFHKLDARVRGGHS